MSSAATTSIADAGDAKTESKPESSMIGAMVRLLVAIGFAAFVVLMVILPLGLRSGAGSDVLPKAALLSAVAFIATWGLYRLLRRLAPMLEADAVILDAELPDETGWLTCEKLTAEQPLVKVILVTSEPGPRNVQLASFVGASALVSHGDGVAALIDEIHGTPVPVAS